MRKLTEREIISIETYKQDYHILTTDPYRCDGLTQDEAYSYDFDKADEYSIKIIHSFPELQRYFYIIQSIITYNVPNLYSIDLDNYSFLSRK